MSVILRSPDFANAWDVRHKGGSVKSKRTLWVVELWDDICDGGWVSSVGVGITRAAARVELKMWKERSPGDRLRVRKYVAEDDR